MPIFKNDEVFIAFEMVLEEAVACMGKRLLAYCRDGKSLASGFVDAGR